MTIRNWNEEDRRGALALWNREAVRDGYKPLDEAGFAALIAEHPQFDPGTAFVAEAGGELRGLAIGCTGDELPLGAQAGYITCVLADAALGEAEADRLRRELLSRLERRFAELGKTQADVLFFNPMRLPWLVPGTPGHEHNNAPGAPAGGALHRLLLEAGYAERSLQHGMHLDLAHFEVPESILLKRSRAAAEGYAVERLDPTRHTGLEELLDALGNPLWQREIADCAARGVPVVAAVYGSRLVGFAGPVVREPSGRGYFAGIGVHPEHEGHGLGSLLFFSLCEAFRSIGTDYMTLFTGSENPALRIYDKAGFKTAKTFAVMRKEGIGS
ncbi:putative acetyltransferase [Paenibacillus pasadenensis]|uniref:Putative acetyltransferase n=1 Tax=Paenibacillus pasadenensis TaxID=217090 RepID=A0A2N5N031_9BACL|nr:GNAT family N-acetyltransferase [Paenibacillus pasadenensis]PLT43693.1 putative acetyltransferase [Paenibacillus pasadenensis]